MESKYYKVIFLKLFQNLFISRFLNSLFYFSHSTEIYCKIIFTVKLQNPVKSIIIERRYCANAASYCLSGKIQILTDMSGIEKHITVTSLSVSPFHPFNIGSPDKCYSARFYKSLVNTSLGYFNRYIRIIFHFHKFVLNCKVSVKSRIKAINSVYKNKGFQ